MGVTGSLSLRVRLLQCPGLHRGGGVLLPWQRPEGPGLPRAARPAPPVPPRPGTEGTRRGATLCGREGRGAGPRGAWRAWGRFVLPGSGRASLAFPGAHGRGCWPPALGGLLLPNQAGSVPGPPGGLVAGSRGGLSLARLVRHGLRRLKRG